MHIHQKIPFCISQKEYQFFRQKRDFEPSHAVRIMILHTLQLIIYSETQVQLYSSHEVLYIDLKADFLQQCEVARKRQAWRRPGRFIFLEQQTHSSVDL